MNDIHCEMKNECNICQIVISQKYNLCKKCKNKINNDAILALMKISFQLN